MDIEALNAKYSLAGTLTFKEGPNGFPIALITTQDATAAITPYGAQLLSCTFASDSQDLLFLSEKAIFKEGTPIRGGVPICWPWFGPGPQKPELPDHGFARTRMWNVVFAAVTPAKECLITFDLTDTPETFALWPYRFRLTLQFTVGKTLTMELTTENREETPFQLTQALHTYLAVGDIAQTSITGLEGLIYADKTDSGAKKPQEGPIRIDSETDRVYPFDGSEIVLHDDSLIRNIRIASGGSKSAVIWNPWNRVCEQKSDLANEDYTKMVCIETANAGEDIITILPGESHTLRALYSMGQ